MRDEIKAGHALLQVMGLGVDVFYAYDESLVSKEETVNDLSKIFLTILHAYKRNKISPGEEKKGGRYERREAISSEAHRPHFLFLPPSLPLPPSLAGGDGCLEVFDASAGPH